MSIVKKCHRNRYYKIPAMQPQFVHTAILKSLLDKLVALGLISELDRFQVYGDAAEAVQRIPGDNFELTAELLMMADSELDDDDIDSEK